MNDSQKAKVMGKAKKDRGGQQPDSPSQLCQTGQSSLRSSTSPHSKLPAASLPRTPGCAGPPSHSAVHPKGSLVTSTHASMHAVALDIGKISQKLLRRPADSTSGQARQLPDAPLVFVIPHSRCSRQCRLHEALSQLQLSTAHM